MPQKKNRLKAKLLLSIAAGYEELAGTEVDQELTDELSTKSTVLEVFEMTPSDADNRPIKTKYQKNSLNKPEAEMRQRKHSI